MWILFALLAAVSAAVVTVMSKAGIKNVDPNLAFAIQAVLIILISWGVVVFQGNVPEVKNIDKRTWMYLGIAGVFTTVSSLLTFQALKLGDASKVNPVERVSLVFAILFAALFLKEKITWQIIIGAVLIIAGAIIIAMAKKSA
ncbi:MAG TPA: EamA family transporter [Flavisolibacter sp.]|jgi:transporter family protein|nr:EamA family transporter [Flavisolibacter sp.]